MDTLMSDTIETHRSLKERLATARGAHPSHDPEHPRDHYPAIDTFLAAASRHNAAVVDVLVPAGRKHLESGAERAREYVERSRRFERSLNDVKAKLYGSAYSVRTPWSRLWTAVEAEFEELWVLELALASDLEAAETGVSWSEKLYDAELGAPTRPHPHIPHQGAAGTVARAVAKRVDSFWDATEGRMIPEPVPHRDREAEGPLVQYLMADPHLDTELVEQVEEQVARENDASRTAEHETPELDDDLT